MALKIDRQEGSLSSLEEMRIKVIFQQSNGQIMAEHNTSNELSKTTWVADSIGDLPVAGDYVMLPVMSQTNDGETGKNSYKVESRSIDFGAFATTDQRIICTIQLTPAIKS